MQALRGIINRCSMWELFREFGSLRVAYAAINLMVFSSAPPPRPVLPLMPHNQQRVGIALKAYYNIQKKNNDPSCLACCKINRKSIGIK